MVGPSIPYASRSRFPVSLYPLKMEESGRATYRRHTGLLQRHANHDTLAARSTGEHGSSFLASYNLSSALLAFALVLQKLNDFLKVCEKRHEGWRNANSEEQSLTLHAENGVFAHRQSDQS
jgi:hypothetical protein